MNHKKVRKDWWTTAIDQPYYEAANRHCVDLKLWCESHWSRPYLTWDEILVYKEDKLQLRHRLIFWLCRLWKEHEAQNDEEADYDIPYVYDELLKRFVRDHNSPGRWVAEGNHQAAISKWRNLSPAYHEDQLGLCAFYAEVEVGFAIKGLENGGFLSSAESSCVVSALFDGARQCEGGRMTGEFLRGFYTALR